jgi:DNA-directed RNA polymerase specialized sigma24 family protein
MESPGSVSGWIDLLQAGGESAVWPLWKRYFPPMVQLARQKLQRSRGRLGDEEDAALSAFDSFCRHAQKGHYPDLRDRNSLWRLLATITARKAAHLVRDDGRKKRGGGKVTSVTPWKRKTHRAESEQIFSREPDPEFAALMADECACLIDGLSDRTLENVALWRMEGYTVKEIAQKMDIVPRSVQRKLEVIRSIWREKLDV